jgi:hypothetical protein
VKEDPENLGLEVVVHYADLFDFKMAVRDIQGGFGIENC